VTVSGRQYEIAHRERRAVAVEVGGGLRSYTVGERAVLLGYSEQELCAAARGQVLAPWPNRLEDGSYIWAGREYQLPISEPSTRTAIHGLVRWANWAAVAHSANRVVLEHVAYPQPGYPFTLRLQVDYRLDESGLTVETTATNVGREPCPFGIAHHPYIAAPAGVEELVVSLVAATRLTVDERKLPAGREPADVEPLFRIGDLKLDTTFTDLGRNPDGIARIAAGDVVVWFDEAFPYVQLFTGDHPDVQRHGLAVEPMTCPPNAFRSGEGLVVLEPGTVFRAHWGIAGPAGLRGEGIGLDEFRCGQLEVVE
jgi:aldose 1-epimerase